MPAFLAASGTVLITTVLAVDMAPVVAANLSALNYYCKTFGIRDGYQMYRYLGVENVPDGVISWLQSDNDESLGGVIVESTSSGLTKEGLGKLSGKTYKITQKGIDIIKKHIKDNNFECYENIQMIKRLENALIKGEKITGADASYYFHEIREWYLMKNGFAYDEAHAAALKIYGVSPFSVYHPDVILMEPSAWGAPWFKFWEISKE